MVAATTVTVTGTYRRVDGTVPEGTITFTPPSTVIDDTRILIDGPATATLDADGSISIVLPVTDGPTNPSGWSYAVAEQVRGARARFFSIVLPEDGGAIVDLSDVSPVEAFDGIITFDADTLGGETAAGLLARANHTGTQLAATISDLAATVATLDTDTVDGSHAADLLARANHTGTQLAATISDFDAAVALLDAGTVGGATAGQLRDRATHTGTQLAATISDLVAAVATLDADTVDGSHAADLLDRANHTGTQLSSTISDLAAASDTASGLIELATQAEVDAGTDAVRAVTPATLAGRGTYEPITETIWISPMVAVHSDGNPAVGFGGQKVPSHSLGLNNKYVVARLYLPSHWATFDIAVDWVVAVTGNLTAGLRADYGFFGPGDDLTSGPTNGPTQTIAAANQNVEKRSTLETGIAVTAAKKFHTRILRASATGTLGADPLSITGILLTKAS